MGDEIDGCECILTHELAMRRLLSMTFALFTPSPALWIRAVYGTAAKKINEKYKYENSKKWTVVMLQMRQGQTYCTDTECIDEAGRLSNIGGTAGNEDTSFTMMTMFMMLALILYFVRPDFLMKMTNVKKPNSRKPPGQDPDGNTSRPAVN